MIEGLPSGCKEPREVRFRLFVTGTKLLVCVFDLLPKEWVCIALYVLSTLLYLLNVDWVVFYSANNDLNPFSAASLTSPSVY